MTRSRNRTRTKGSRPKKRGPKPALEDINGVIRIKKNVFDKVRSNEDFAAMVRVGRLLNVLGYMGDAIGSAPKVNYKEDPLTFRNFTRAMFNTAGYIYECYELVASLYPKYQDADFFEKFANLYNDPEKARKRKVMRLMRNAGAFHLDSDNQSTKKALAKLKLNKFDLVSSKDGTFGTMYFHLSDTLDINYVIDELKEPGNEDEKAIYFEMGKLSADLWRDFIFGADQFVQGIATKLGFI